MDRIEVLLTPIWREERAAFVKVCITMLKPEMEQDSRIFQLYKIIVGVPFLSFTKKILLQDEAGELDYATAEKESPKVIMEEYYLKRDTSGDIHISYEVELKPVGKNPAFDLGFEDGGMDGSGMSFMPMFQEKEYQFLLQWDLSQAPEGTRAIWSLGEGCIETVQSGTVLAESFYYAGNIKGIEKNGCGFYWFDNPKLPGEEVGRFVRDLFQEMKEFFQDGGETYSVFSRKVPEVLTGRNKIGGLALTRSFLYLYPEENPPKEETLKFLFPHEMVHNWIKMKDEPFGSCTWYVEGAAEYYSMVLPDRFGMITKEELTAQLNKKARDYYENPRLQVTNHYAGEHLFIDGEATLVPYGRGFFYLLHMDDIIKKATGSKKSLDDVVLAILARTRTMEECGNEVWLEEVKRISGLDVTREFEEMQSGKIFPPTVSSFHTPVTVADSRGIQRETGEECILYHFE